MGLSIEPVGAENWRAVAALEVTDDQRRFVAEPAYYLCLCAYGDLWHPLAVRSDGEVIGFLMWAIDDDDRSCWLGGVVIDRRHQRQGHGRGALGLAIEELRRTQKPSGFALSYEPDNPARNLYLAMGFTETGEMEDDEVVARYSST